MRKRRFTEWIKRPHGVALALFYVFAALVIAAAVVCTVAFHDGKFAYLAYICYALAALSLGYVIYTLVVLAPSWKKKAVTAMQRHSFTNKMYEHYGFRTIIFATCSLVINLGNAVLNGSLGIVRLSLWYGTLGVYYLALFSVRGSMLLYHRKNKKSLETDSPAQLRIRDAKAYRTCGIFLVLLPLALSGIIIQTVLADGAFVHAGLLIYVFAAYTVYKIVMSVKNFFKARKGDELTVRAIRNVNLADALVSVLALQTAMFHEFSPQENFGTANALTGAAVCALTVALGIYMIAAGCAEIKKIKLTETEGEPIE